MTILRACFYQLHAFASILLVRRCHVSVAFKSATQRTQTLWDVLVAGISPHQLQQKETKEFLRLNIKKPRILMGLVSKSSGLFNTRPNKNDQQSYDYANRDINEACSSRHPDLSMVRLGDHNRKRDSSETKRA